jgi:hypothetical protein
MNSTPCDREEELAEAIRMERWPTGAPAELRNHVAGCPDCAELSLITGYLRQEGKLAQSEAVLPDSGFVWWKARLLARRAAAERATRPVVIAERVGLIAGALAAAGLAAWQWPLIRESLAFSNLSISFPFHPGAWLGFLAASLAGTVVVAGIGLYLISSER